MVRRIDGGSGSLAAVGHSAWVGPIKIHDAYPTTANGWAEEVSCQAGEVLVKLRGGSPGSFSAYIAGSAVEVAADIRERMQPHVDGEKFRIRITPERGERLLAELATLGVVDSDPCAKLAHALGKSPEEVATAARLSGLAL